MPNWKNNEGFTLVELLVVIAVIGILAVLAVPALFKNIEKGKVADLEGDISAIRTSSISFYSENGVYPEYDEIKNYIEGISNPFKGTYKLEGGVPNDLVLKIKFEEGKMISSSALEKLKRDLGDRVDTESIHTNNLINDNAKAQKNICYGRGKNCECNAGNNPNGNCAKDKYKCCDPDYKVKPNEKNCECCKNKCIEEINPDPDPNPGDKEKNTIGIIIIEGDI